MNKFNRFILIFISIIGLLSMTTFASMAYPVPYLSNFASHLWQNGLWFSYTVVVVSIILGLFFLILLLTAIFVPTSDKFLTIKTGMGDIDISKKTIESTARQSFSDLTDAKNPEVHAKLKRKAKTATITVKATVVDAEKLPTLGKEIQQRVEESIQRALEIPVKSVNVKISEAHATNGTAKSSHSPRVV